jgi:hypothetical protein
VEDEAEDDEAATIIRTHYRLHPGGLQAHAHVCQQLFIDDIHALGDPASLSQ